MSELTLDKVGKTFGSTEVLHDLSLTVGSGEFASFVGPSGCGKSTLLRIIAGLERATTGEIRIEGRNVGRLEPVERGVAMVFQNYALYPHMTVRQNIAFPLHTIRLPRHEVDEKVAEAARTLRLTDRLSHKPAALSGGQRQRVAIGRAIVRDPKVFLFDEPLSNLDAALRNEMRIELAELHARLGTTMVYVTHDQVEAMTMSDRIALLNAGQIEQVGTPTDLYHHPATRFVAEFIGRPAMNMLIGNATSIGDNAITVIVEDQEFQVPVDPGTSPPQPGEAVTLGVRPESVLPAEMGIRAEVQMVEYLGGVSVIHARTQSGQRLAASVPGAITIARHAVVGFRFDPVDTHLFTPDGLAFRRRAVPAAALPAFLSAGEGNQL
ncbi:MAG: sn-glycerol-3-phosphate ABC transporter ATP-binding protein UgpC [Pseudomonadota bacterium]